MPTNATDIVIWDGACSGVDDAGHAFAKSRGYSFERRPFIEGFGKAGGPMRNMATANELAGLVKLGHRAFGMGWRWTFLTKGTKSMAEQLDRVGISYRFVMKEAK